MKQRIMLGAMAEMTERGLKFTMDDLARRLGMSKRTLYENFSSKDELIAFLLAESVAEIKTKREAIARDQTLGIREKFKQMLLVRTSFWNESTEFLALDIKKCMPEQWKKVESAMDDLWQMTEDLMSEGVQKGVFRPVFFPAVRVMFKGACNEFTNYQYLLRYKVTINEMIEHMLDILMFGLVTNEHCQNVSKQD